MRAQAMTSDLKVELIEIGHKMNQAGLSKPFIAVAVETAFEFEGVYDLMKMWDQTKLRVQYTSQLYERPLEFRPSLQTLEQELSKWEVLHQKKEDIIMKYYTPLL